MVKKVKAIQINDTSKIVKNADYNTKVKEIEDESPNRDKYIITKEFNKITAENVTAKLKQTKSATKDDIADFVK